MKMKAMLGSIVIVMVLIFSSQSVFASDLQPEISKILDEQLDAVDLEQFDEILNNQNLKDLKRSIGYTDFRELAIKIIKGELDLSLKELISTLLKMLFQELRLHITLLVQILIICILSQVIKNLELSFNSDAISEISFYIIYITLIILLFNSFTGVLKIVNNTINELHTVMRAVLPTMITLILASGNVTSGASMYSIIVVALDTMTVFIQNMIINAISFIVILEIVNNISKQPILKHLLDYSKKIINKVLKIIVALFTIVMGLQSIAAPMVDGIINKSAKYAMGSLPVVGSALSGVVDTVLGCSTLIKNGVGVGVVILLFLICLIPILKVLAMIIMYKIAASFIQPISDNRIVNCLSSIGDYCSLLLGVMITVMIMFIASIAILVGATNITMMIR